MTNSSAKTAETRESAYATPAIEDRVDLVASLSKNCSNINQASQ